MLKLALTPPIFNMAQWYQDGAFITVSLKLDVVVDKSSVRAQFNNNQCTVLESDKVLWQCYLAHPVVPEKCKIKPAGKRIELKLKKSFPLQWSELEGVNDIEKENITTNNHKVNEGKDQSGPLPLEDNHDPIDMETDPSNHVNDDIKYDDDEEEEEMYHTPPTNSPPQSLSHLDNHIFPSAKKFFGDMEDVHQLKYLTHDMIEKDNNQTISVKLMVPHINPQSCVISFNRQSLIVQFSTNDNRFLHSYPGSTPATQFTWNINLFDSIVPDKSQYFVRDKHIELLLTKTRPHIRWKCLESLSPSTDNNFSSLQTTPTARDTHLESVVAMETEKSEYLQNDINGMNNLDIDSDELSTTSQGGVVSTKDSQTVLEFNPFMLRKKPSLSSRDHQMLNDLSNPQSLIDNNITGAIPSLNTSNNKAKIDPEFCGSSLNQSSPVSSAKLPSPRSTNQNPFHRLSSELFSGPSLTGIANMGNTCFMSSVVQCLSNTVEVRDFFLGGQYKRDINVTNPLGCQGKLSECFASVIDKLWSGQIQWFAPKQLKELVSLKGDRFSGYSQQDAHEFTTFLLDILHEDLNKIKDKALTSQAENEGQSDSVVASQSWSLYKKRNDSFFVDLFGGQFKSTLVCPECSKVSVTFDPFMSLSVPLPRKSRILSVVFISKDPEKQPEEVVLQLPPEATFELLKASVARKTGIQMTRLRVFKACNDNFQNMFSNSKQPISEIRDDDVIVVSEVLSYLEAKEKIVEIYVIQRLQYPPLPIKCSRKKCGKKRIELKRCGRCKYVAYCSKECQQQDWDFHKLHCKLNIRTPIALPFVISLPITSLTYDKIAEKAELYARWSVMYHRPTLNKVDPPTAPPSGLLATVDDTATSGNSDSQNISTHESAGPRPMFDLIPVNEYGDKISGEGPLQNKGKETLSLPTQYLAMDWRNNPKDKDFVEVTVKDDKLYRKAAKDLSEKNSCDIKLEDCLLLFTEPETLPKDNAWYCPRCKEHREATKQISVWRLPPVLIIHLKRFSFLNLVMRDKIDKLVKFPLRGLNMAPYILGEAATQITSETLYDLYATVNHYGTVSLGHYTSTIKSPVGDRTEWLYYDDENVTKVSEKEVITKYAYILFYRRRDL